MPFEQIRDIISKQLEIDEEDITMGMDTVTEQTRLAEDLGCDSLTLMMLSMEIEDAFHFRFSEFVKFETVGDIVRYFEEL